MPSRYLTSKGVCSVCGAPLIDAVRYCPTCSSDVGAPNVRACLTDENLKALNERFDKARSHATSNGCLKEFDTLDEMLRNESGVVISIPARIARNLFEDPKSLYANYEKLVGAKMRVTASAEDDKHRFAIGGMLFGSYANSIIYGALSLTEHGLSTYGEVHCRLKSVAIERRTSFLEKNSYKFIRDHGLVAGDKLPEGFSACWADRQKLVLAKLASALSAGQGPSDWQAIICQSDGANREDDEFVEAHIYEGFNWNAIESMVETVDRKMTRSERLDFDLANDAFGKLQGKLK